MTRNLITGKPEVALSSADYEALAALRHSIRRITAFSSRAAL
jgi:hypothetical protein